MRRVYLTEEWYNLLSVAKISPVRIVFSRETRYKLESA